MIYHLSFHTPAKIPHDVLVEHLAYAFSDLHDDPRNLDVKFVREEQ